MSRFLIRPSVNCHNLAPRVLGMAWRGLGRDCEAQYGYRPWRVESFVDTEQFTGTCDRAANWLALGQTEGRGRQDRERKKNKSVKASASILWNRHGSTGWGFPSHLASGAGDWRGPGGRRVGGA